MVALSSAESELYAAVKTASEGLGIQSAVRDLGILQTESALGSLGNDVPGQSQGTGKAKHVDMQNLWKQEASKSVRFATKKVDTSVNPADLMTKPIPKARVEQLMSLMGCEFVSAMTSSLKGQVTMTLTSGGNSLTTAIVHQCGVVSGTLATRRILTSVLRRPRWRGEIGDFWQCRAGNVLIGIRIRDGETGSHPERVDIL